MNYLFWNVHKNENNEMIKDIICLYKPDIAAFSEYEGSINKLLKLLDKNKIYYYDIPKIACRRLTIISKFKLNMIDHFNDHSYYTIKSFPYNKEKQLVVFLHFPSKLHTDDDTYMTYATELKGSILESKNKSRINNIIVMGDFNMNPYEKPMLAAQGLHAVSSGKVAAGEKRTVGGYSYEMFYNPMWNLLGDFDEPIGTYYYRDSSAVCCFWNVFDQVLVSPALVSKFQYNKLKIITKINETQLMSNGGKPNEKISDHFPLFFSID